MQLGALNEAFKLVYPLPNLFQELWVNFEMSFGLANEVQMRDTRYFEKIPRLTFHPCDQVLVIPNIEEEFNRKC